ncbi:hypothetical protein, partial [Streptomyces sp. NPDC048603]|uniref:hypothetical protein n=1 Tax=Streptomyces sp. NPDC048603 TaxID=3365577 RepID=UPI003717F28E
SFVLAFPTLSDLFGPDFLGAFRFRRFRAFPFRRFRLYQTFSVPISSAAFRDSLSLFPFSGFRPYQCFSVPLTTGRGDAEAIERGQDQLKKLGCPPTDVHA